MKIRKILISIIGGILLIIGIIMIIIPGPAYLIIPAGLGILGTEYIWARRMHDKIKNGLQKFLKLKKLKK